LVVPATEERRSQGPPVSAKIEGEVPGSWIGRYLLKEKLGEGGFGVVYRAEQEKPLRRRVALKIIKPGMDTEDVIRRFEAERATLAQLSHPNVAQIFDAGATDSGAHTSSWNWWRERPSPITAIRTG